ncbi:MAG: hypothetical protein JST80_02135 [Bdellovibrionales bacterium]|nr:hypothetical protein [Bdellovibrionales bacterium]
MVSRRFFIEHYRSVLAFLAVWFAYGLMTEADDLHTYSLYQGVAESIVERHTFAIGNSRAPDLREFGDVFNARDMWLPAKQPGSFVMASVPYAIFHLFGYNYSDDYRLVSAMTTWWTCGFLAALSVVLLFHFLLTMGYARKVAATCAFAYGFASTIFPYTGVPHHDVIATTFVLLAFMLMFLSSPMSSNRRVAFIGFLLGFTIFTSMLPALLVAALCLFSLYHLKFRKTVVVGFGFLLGYLPLACYNAHYFGSPFRQANQAGNYNDTFFKPSLDLFWTQLNLYFGFNSYITAMKCMPIFVLGLAGLFFLKPKLRRMQAIILVLVAIHLFYLFSIEAEGHCQYGPRYLIPLIPFAMIGVSAWFESAAQKLVMFAALIWSFGVNLVGASGSSMYCANLIEFPLWVYWRDRAHWLGVHRPLEPVILLGTIAAIIYWISARRTLRTGARDHPRSRY